MLSTVAEPEPEPEPVARTEQNHEGHVLPSVFVALSTSEFQIAPDPKSEYEPGRMCLYMTIEKMIDYTLVFFINIYICHVPPKDAPIKLCMYVLCEL